MTDENADSKPTTDCSQISETLLAWQQQHPHVVGLGNVQAAESAITLTNASIAF